MRPERLYLVDIVEAADAVTGFLAGVSKDAFVQDDLLRSAVLHPLAVVGEAAARVSDETRAAHVTIPWADVIGFRTISVNAYFAVDWEIVWTTATKDLPALRAAAAAILEGLPEA